MTDPESLVTVIRRLASLLGPLAEHATLRLPADMVRDLESWAFRDMRADQHQVREGPYGPGELRLYGIKLESQP